MKLNDIQNQAVEMLISSAKPELQGQVGSLLGDLLASVYAHGVHDGINTASDIINAINA